MVSTWDRQGTLNLPLRVRTKSATVRLSGFPLSLAVNFDAAKDKKEEIKQTIVLFLVVNISRVPFAPTYILRTMTQLAIRSHYDPYRYTVQAFFLCTH